MPPAYSDKILFSTGPRPRLRLGMINALRNPGEPGLLPRWWLQLSWWVCRRLEVPFWRGIGW
jgi:hypothetical protein